ncbi:MAG: hypothetical protein KDK55_05875 [Chlamydiia bacterium]|nr:hypothetical protein [Chlamydiia bacterium]
MNKKRISYLGRLSSISPGQWVGIALVAGGIVGILLMSFGGTALFVPHASLPHGLGSVIGTIGKGGSIAFFASGGGLTLGGAGGIGLILMQCKTIDRSFVKKKPIAKIDKLLHQWELKQGIAQVDATYDYDDQNVIIDLAYVDCDYGMGCVVDGTGHNNSKMREPLQDRFDHFIATYIQGLSELVTQDNVTFEKIESYFKEKIRNLETSFKSNTKKNRRKVYPGQNNAYENDVKMGTFLDETFKPAMSFVQVVRLEEKTLLLTAQVGDTLVYVEKNNGTLMPTQGMIPHFGLGSVLGQVNIETFDITDAKRVIGFSDGIHDFVTQEEFKDIIKKNKINTLLSYFKQSIQGDEAPQDDSPLPIALGGNPKRYFDPSKKNAVDDISLFVLEF